MGLNKYIDFSTAKLLKEKGFDKRTPLVWLFSLGKTHLMEIHLSLELNNNEYNAPTIAEVVMWCFKTHKIWITVDVNINGKFNYLLRQFNSKDRAWEVKNPSSIQEYFNNPDDAYSSGITYFLNNLEMSN